MKLYAASSWKNIWQPSIVKELRRCGHEVYDYRHPAPGNNGFSWDLLLKSMGKDNYP